jgi:peptide/nickel transport system substrate-binding protein
MPLEQKLAPARISRARMKRLLPLLIVSAVVVASAFSVSSGTAGLKTTAKAQETNLTVAVPRTPRSLWSSRSWDNAMTIVNSIVTTGLLQMDEAGRLRPEIASAWKAVNPTTYQYTIRPTLKFSNGQPVTAEDVAFAMTRNLDPKAASEVSSFYTNVKSITAVGTNQVTVKLKRPDIQWQYTPAHLSGFVFEKAGYLKDPDAFGTPENMPIGAGPYMYQSYVPDSKVVVVRNPFWQGPKPRW